MGLLRILLIVGVSCIFAFFQVNCQEKGKKVSLDKKGQIDKNSAEVKDLLTANNLTEDVSFRCGIFFAGKNFKDKPFQKLFIIPKRFPINQTYYNPEKDSPKVYSNDVCPIAEPYGTVDHVSVHNDTCFNIVRKSTLFVLLFSIVNIIRYKKTLSKK